MCCVINVTILWTSSQSSIDKNLLEKLAVQTVSESSHLQATVVAQ